MLTLRVERRPVLASDQEAMGPLTAVAQALAPATRAGLLWARCRRTLVPFDAGTFELLLSRERSFRADSPGRPTHVLSLCATPEGPGEVGVVLVNVRADPSPDAAPGLTLSVSLADDVFDTGALALRSLLERCIATVSPDVAVVGPGAWVRELGTGWATFARRLRRDALPAGAIVVTTATGSIVIAHREEPASESTSARESVQHVGDALAPDAPRTAAASPPPPREAPSVMTPAAPSFLIVPPPTQAARDPLTGTALDMEIPLGPALPFVAGAYRLPETSTSGGRAQLTGTVDAPGVSMGPVLPFGPGAPLAVPELTLERYAHLRAQLTVRGEEDAATWSQFGLDSRAAKEALQARFAARFRRDPAAQARFVELVQRRSAELRAR